MPAPRIEKRFHESTFNMLRLIALLSLLLVPLGQTVATEAARTATLYKNPQCGCCETYADYLRQNGYEVTVEATHDLPLIKREQGVPAKLEGCHTTLIDGYVVEGHVPVGPLNRLLAERPAIRGISLPGMPMGSPGMDGPKATSFMIYEISDGPAKVYAVE